MTIKAATASLLAALVLAGCQSGVTGQNAGTVGGAVAGGILGAQFGGGSGQLIATGVGTLLGAYVGNQLGQQFDRRDYSASNSAGQSAFASGQQQSWQGPSTSGTITPVGGIFIENGRECQNFSQSVMIAGQPNTTTGVVCRTIDGTWQVVRYN